MSNKGHNKKRNTGLLYEFLVRNISSALVGDDQRRSATALKILKQHFKPGSVLYKEFRLINALIKTTVSSEAVAASIMQEAKTAARSHDVKQLDREKSLLIRNINHKLNDGVFYDHHVNEYRTYATIQTLLNDWRLPDSDLERMAEYEDQLVKHLTAPKEVIQEQFINEESAGTGRMLVKVMMKKLNEKYSGVLNEAQRAIVKAYAWSSTNDEQTTIKQKLVEVRDELVKSIVEFTDNNPSEFVNTKLNDVRVKLLSEALDTVDDDTVTRFMLYIKLNDELMTEDTNATS